MNRMISEIIPMLPFDCPLHLLKNERHHFVHNFKVEELEFLKFYSTYSENFAVISVWPQLLDSSKIMKIMNFLSIMFISQTILKMCLESEYFDLDSIDHDNILVSTSFSQRKAWENIVWYTCQLLLRSFVFPTETLVEINESIMLKIAVEGNVMWNTSHWYSRSSQRSDEGRIFILNLLELIFSNRYFFLFFLWTRGVIHEDYNSTYFAGVIGKSVILIILRVQFDFQSSNRSRCSDSEVWP